MSDDGRPHEIIIVKRQANVLEDGHHGGSWKIAYADFVTAMMAFFLVMWLVSANDKTRSVVARYFNPVQLVDSTPQPPGLSDPNDGAPNVPQKSGAKPVRDARAAAAAKEAKPTDRSRRDDADLFKDPAAALSEIAARDGAQPEQPARAAAKNPRHGTTASDSAGQKGGEAFRDPFEPLASTAADAGAEPARIEAAAPLSAPARVVAENAPAPEPASALLPGEPQARAAELKSRVEGLMKAAAAASSGPEPKVDVKATPEGLLITLTDDARFAMFASASAEPAPRMVVLMEKIGRLLKAQKGKVTVRGFTDSRKFKSDTYDNWRLSSARAHMAHYMLTRGGLEEARIERIEGYADHQPRNLKDPESPDNRRIEILLREAP
jgi:chemotaxis protein MotB